MKRGLFPCLSGDYENPWKDSNGAWIRTEIWACLAPGCPEIAARYAMEDAVVDHGAGEGTYAAVFVAAMQSAAFVIPDLRRAIAIGLDLIPEDCRTAMTVRTVLECYDTGVSPVDCRNRVLAMNADIGDGWFQAPSNVGYSVLGMIYGEGDFKKSMLLAINCGDDTDCTAATLGATMGILGGRAALPDDWCEYLGDGIVTVSIAGGVLTTAPKTCTELTERVVRLAPTVLLSQRAKMEIVAGESELEADISLKTKTCDKFRRRLQRLSRALLCLYHCTTGVS
jgi:ADP-ribosylglycohydrolase